MDFIHRSLGKNKSAAEPVSSDSVWVKVSPDHPHVGIASISSSKENPWEHAIKVLGVAEDAAKRIFTGKVIDLPAEVAKAVQSGKSSLTVSEFIKLFR